MGRFLLLTRERIMEGLGTRTPSPKREADHMLFVVDIGNTNTVFGLIPENGEPIYFRTHSEEEETDDFLQAKLGLFFSSKGMDPSQVDGAILCSVVPALGAKYERILSSLFSVRVYSLGPGLKTGLPIKTDNPKEVGADLIADCVGALSHYGPGCLIIDMGTANKVLLLDKDGCFAGCTIGAGLGLQRASLTEKTAVLPSVSLQIPNKILGKNTMDCMNSALTYGVAFGLKGLCDGIEKEVGYPLKRILTGGYANYIAPLMEGYSFDSDLLMKGLVEIYRRNKK